MRTVRSGGPAAGHAEIGAETGVGNGVTVERDAETLRVAFDHQAFCRRPYTGISRYFTRLAQEFLEFSQVDARIVAPVHVNALLGTSVIGARSGHFLPWHPRVLRPLIRQVSGVAARARIGRWRPDLVHETYFDSLASAPRGTPMVLTVFDLVHERYPGLFPFHARTLRAKQRAIERASALICISQATADDLADVYPGAEQRSRVIHLGVDTKPQDHPPPALSGVRPFFLFVGERGGYKNFPALAKAFASSTLLAPDYQLVCCGGGALTRAERAQLAALGIGSRVRQVRANDQSLDSLYRSATALVYPSVCEGFGLPLLEAMTRGCPVLASQAAALREVAGPAARFFDPHDIDEMRGALETLALAPELAARLRSAGFERVRRFTWQRCARETLQCYRMLCS